MFVCLLLQKNIPRTRWRQWVVKRSYHVENSTMSKRIVIIMFNISITQISIWIWSNALYNSRGNQINTAQITILQFIIPPIKSSQLKSNAGFRWTRWKSPESQRQWCDQQIIEEIDDTIWWIHDGKITLKKQIIFHWNNLFLLQNNRRHYLFLRHVLTTITSIKICWFINHL